MEGIRKFMRHLPKPSAQNCHLEAPLSPKVSPLQNRHLPFLNIYIYIYIYIYVYIYICILIYIYMCMYIWLYL